MPAYRYVLCDLLTDRPVAQLPLTGVTFDRRISRTGSLSGSFEAPTSQLVEAAKLAYRFAGRSALWVYRDNEIWWGGICWTVTARQGQRGAVSVDVQAATFDSYAHHRQLYDDLDYTETDQGIIIPSLWRTIQADPRGNIRVQALDQPTGVLRDRSYIAADQEYVGKLIEDLGDIVDGPEHTIDTYLAPDGTRTKRLRVADLLGVPQNPATFQRSVGGGGRLLEWAHTADAVDGGTTFQVRADAATTDTSDRLYADDLLTDGWPLLDVTEDQPATDDEDVETEQAWTLASQRAGAIRTSSYTVQIGNTGWSPNRLGDLVRLKLADDWHTDTDTDTDLLVRPVGVRVTAPTNSTGETVDLLFGDTDT